MSREFLREDVPAFRRRLGDTVLAGSNNTVVVLGRDRPGDRSSGLGSVDGPDGGRGCGTFHIICGRSGEDPDFSRDKSFVYVSAKTEVDRNMSFASVESTDSTGPSVAVKTDHLRMSAKDFKMVCDSSYVFANSSRVVVESKEVRLGKDARQEIIRGSDFRNSQKQLHSELKQNFVQIQTDLAAAGLALKSPNLAKAAVSFGLCAKALDSFEGSSGQFLSRVSKTV